MWKHKMDLARRKRRKQCTSAEEYDISAHEDIKTSAIFFQGNKGCAPLCVPYLGKLSEYYNFQRTWKGITESFLNTVWDLDELVSTKDLEVSFFISITKEFETRQGGNSYSLPVL